METALILVYSFFYVIFKVLFGIEDDLKVKDAKRYKDGVTLLKNKKYHEALSYFDKVLTNNPRSVFALICRAQSNLKLNEILNAIVDSSRAATLENNVPEAYMIKGKALYKLNEMQKAFIEFDKAVWYFRDNAEAFRWRAILHLHFERTDKAMKDLKKAISLGDEEANYILLSKTKFPRRITE